MIIRFVLLCFLTGTVLSEPNIILITEDWPPYNYQQNDQLKGFSVEIAQAMMDDMGVSIKIQLLPGARGEWLLDTQPNVINFTLFRSPNREHKYQWIGPIADETIYFYKHAGSDVQIESLEDAKEYVVGSLNIGFVRTALSEQGFHKLEGVSDQKSLPLMLITDRIELMVNLPELGNSYMLKEENLTAALIENTGVVLAKLPLYFAVSKDLDPNIVSRWQASLDAIKASGKYQEIYDQYMQ